jgi:phosphoglycolate phosphatase
VVSKIIEKYDVVVWDWNGTLVDDYLICTDNFNKCITQQGIPPVTPEYFRKLVRHPIIDMYHAVGFKFTKDFTFEDHAKQWYQSYKETMHVAPLFDGVEKILEWVKILNKTQIICSALEHTYLLEQVNLKNLSYHFDLISGHQDLECDSKVERGATLIKSFQSKGANVVMIGDSTHDAHVAESANCDCILLASGHEDIERLAKNKNATLLRHFSELLD